MIIEENLSNSKVIAGLIDHTLLKPEAVASQVKQLCREARDHGFASVCINPYWVPSAVDALSGSDVRVCTVIGFPLGSNDPKTKHFEAELALSQGATELDMVLNVSALLSGKDSDVQTEIAGLAELTHGRGAILKVILETCLLTDPQKMQACKIAVCAGADFVKTSTGFSTGGATVEDIRLMREAVGPAIGVKASGGIRSLHSLRQMVIAGANRIGTSSGVKIMQEYGESDRTESSPSAEGEGPAHLGARADTY